MTRGLPLDHCHASSTAAGGRAQPDERMQSMSNPIRELVVFVGQLIATRSRGEVLPVGETRRQFGALAQQFYAAVGPADALAIEPRISAVEEAIEGLLCCRGYGAQLEVALRVADRAQGWLGTILAASPNKKEDGSAYRPKKECLGDKHPNFKTVDKALMENEWIRTRRPVSSKSGKPIRNRLEVHVGDWHKYLASLAGKTPDPLDMPAEIVDEKVREIEARKAQERARRPKND